MRRILLALACFVCVAGVSSLVRAEPPGPAPDCAAQATDQKLAGATLASFMKKCERDAATAKCEAAATEKKLAGAARKSFAKKCVQDATAMPGFQ
jgi:hypothetical protein